MRTLKLFLPVVVAAFLCNTDLIASDLASIEGTVTYADGAPMVDAVIELSDSGLTWDGFHVANFSAMYKGRVVRTARTESTGRFAVVGVKPAFAYLLSVRTVDGHGGIGLMNDVRAGEARRVTGKYFSTCGTMYWKNAPGLPAFSTSFPLRYGPNSHLICE